MHGEGWQGGCGDKCVGWRGVAGWIRALGLNAATRAWAARGGDEGVGSEGRRRGGVITPCGGVGVVRETLDTGGGPAGTAAYDGGAGR